MTAEFQQLNLLILTHVSFLRNLRRQMIAASGGSVILQGGEGRHTSIHDGTDGGSVALTGGKSYGHGYHDDGGSVNIAAGAALRGDGGGVNITSGSSLDKSSE